MNANADVLRAELTGWVPAYSHGLQKEIEKAGFRLARTADFLRNSSDTRDWNDAPFAAADRRGKSDRFVLLFVKPE